MWSLTWTFTGSGAMRRGREYDRDGVRVGALDGLARLPVVRTRSIVKLAVGAGVAAHALPPARAASAALIASRAVG